MSLKKLTFQLQGISLWLNQGSTIRLRWEEHTTTGLDKLHGMVVKGHAFLFIYFFFHFFEYKFQVCLKNHSYFAGDVKFEQLQDSHTTFLDAISLRETVNGNCLQN